VQDIEGLENFTHPKGHTVVQALNAAQLRSLYSAAAIYAGGGKHGTGRTIGISNFDGFMLSNVPLEYSLMGLPSPVGGIGSNITVVPVAGGSGSTGSGVGEGDLDIQAALGMAPLCNLIIYDNYQSDPTASNNPIALLTKEADDNKADIITESYGWNFDTGTALSAHNLHVSMSAQGITYLVASGDSGTTWVSQGSDYDYPATDPEVLLVGGTSVILNNDGSRASEIGWNSNGGAGGGGWNATTDSFNKRPTYQSTKTFLGGKGVPSLTSVPYRLVPDVALDADPSTGYLVYVDGQENQIGGTSGASPTCAGLLAELEQQLITDNALTANAKGMYRLGRIQDLLYSYNGSSQVFYDVTYGTNGQLPNGNQSNAGIGWDTDTGWGAIIFSGLQTQIEQSLFTCSLLPSTVTAGTSSTGTVTIPTVAPSGGTVVTLKSSSPDAVVPSSVTVPAGSTTATFSVTTKQVTAATTATITATENKQTTTSTLTINPYVVLVSSVSVDSSSLVGGATTTGTVTLSNAAPSTGSVVTLKSSLTNAKVPTSVIVPSGETSVTFNIATTAVSANKTATITATLAKSSATTNLTLTPNTVSGIQLSTPSTIGGSNVTVTGVVTLSTPATGTGIVVALKSSSTSAASVPSSVTVKAGQSSVTFTVTDKAVTTSAEVTISATLNGSDQTSTLHVSPFVITGLTLTPSTLVGGASSTGVVTLNATPSTKTGAVVVSLKSTLASAKVPASVSVTAGKSTATFTIKTSKLKSTTSSTITATRGSASMQQVLTVQS
jgi:hypothetical protein